MILISNCLHTRFEAQAAEVPEAPALTYAAETLSYGQLNARANQLAHYLRRCGADSGQRVGLCLNRTLDPVIAMLAVLKSGAAYVPMDPLYPADRVKMIVDDAQCPVVIVHAEHRDHFAGNDATVIVLDGDTRPWEAESADNLDLPLSPADIAYVIYTSGSTGKPKGAVVTHWNVYRLFEAMQPDFGFRSDDVWTLFHSYAFDFSVSEMWGALFFGGRIVMVPYLVSRSPEDFYQLLLDEGVTVLNQTPSAFKQLQHHDESLPIETSRQLALRYVLVGGEYMSLPSLAPWFERHGDEKPKLVHVYGITETTVFVTYRPLTLADTAPGTPSFIGKVIDDLYIHVLDEAGGAVAVGEVGELYVGGPGVCLGYLNRPELTAERFVPDPFDTSAFPPTMYKTGDLVRLFENDLEFVGRNDNQIQLRGFRVELGEIEAELNEAPGVRSAIVRLREDIPGDPRLVAYYLAREPIALRALREHLLRTLPPYMVPSAFVHIDEFPLNNNGKIENDALPAPLQYLQSDVAYVAPANPCEENLAAIWTELLGLPKVGTNDNFIHLGGHSLHFTQLLVRIKKSFGVELSLREAMEHPTIQAHAAAIEKALASGVTASHGHALPIADRDAPIPLSFAQERLWIIERMDPGNTTYNVPILFEIHGDVEVERLQSALDAVVARHEVLRTIFASTDGQPRQVILSELGVPMRIVDLGIAPEDESFGRVARERLSNASREVLSLESPPLLQFFYFPHRKNHGWLGLVIHHAIFDGWSINVLLNDLSRAYSAPQGASLPPLRVQYADYSRWQRDGTETEAYQRQLSYWKNQLAGPLPVLDFPTDFPRPPRQTWDGAVAQHNLGDELSSALEHFARREGKTLFVVLAAAWNTLLYRYSGQEDLLVGSAIAGRNHQDLEELIGFFVNTVVLRSQISPTHSFREYLGELEATVVGAQDHQDVPFDQVVAEVHHERDPSRSPLFQVLFVLHNTPPFEVSFSGLHMGGEEISNGGAKFDLSLSIQPRDGALVLNLEYNTALFKTATAEKILNSYRTLLKSAIAAPEAKVGDLNMLDAAERKLLLEAWTATEAPLDRGLSLMAAFEAQATAHPDAIAVADDAVSMTFAELERQANQLAHYLLAQGVAPEEPVPFFLGRTVRAIVAIIGILKAGAAYVPLDLLDPPGRRERVLSVLRPRMILTEDELAPQLRDASIECVCLDSPGLLAGFSSERTGVSARGDDLAYVIFTSGSTGDPKGVCCTHQGVINLHQDLQSRLPVGPGDPCAIWTAFSFDVSVYESWTSLLAGATLHIIPERVRANPEACLGWLRERHVITGYIPGFMLPTLLEIQRRDPLPLRRLLVGVEPLSEALLSDIVAATPGLVLLNLYGPTEAAVYVTLYQAHDTYPRPPGNAPIGKAIQNTRIYILDPNMNPVPPGVPGELYIAGVGLARGYYNDPELTSRQFVPDPFSDKDTARLYRTGDLVFFKPDGNIQFLRRMGRYIKLRGYRIEPGEIESVLRAHSGIDDAVAVMYEKEPDNPRIVAYLVPCDPQVREIAELDVWLSDRLPAHMRPSQLVFIPAFPRTVQGKLDRKALPDPPSLHQSEGTRRAPQSESEARLIALWETLLGISNIDARENFFAIGGHSLLAIQLISRISSDFGVDIPLRTFMEAPTIAECAVMIEDAASVGDGGPTRAPIPHADRSRPIPLSHAQERLWVLEQLSPGMTAYNVPLRIRIHGAVERGQVDQALSWIVERHETLRTLLPTKAGTPEQRILPAADISATFVSLMDLPEAERESRYLARALEIAQRPMDLAEGPILYAELTQFAPKAHSLTVLVHHIAFDGWSIRLFLEELADALQAAAAGEKWQPPALAHQYADYALWQRTRDHSPEMAAELDYWKGQLAGPLPILEMPTDYPRPKTQTWKGAQLFQTLEGDLAAAVDGLARALDVTPFALLLAGWKALLFRYTGQSDIIVGAAMAGRNHREWEPLIGFFVNTVALRTEVARDMAFEGLVSRVRDVALEAQEHQSVSFDRVIAEIQPDRDQSRSPVFQTMFVLHNTPRYEAKRSTLELTAEGLDNGGAKFDLSLAIHPSDGNLVFNLEYNTTLFEPATAERILNSYRALLTSAIAAPRAAIGALNILDEAEKKLLLEDWTATEAPLDRGLALAAAFEARVATHPDAIAVADDETSLTFAELDRRANQLAHYLLARGVAPEEPVPFFLGRTVRAIVAIIGILKAGAAYVPLDLLDPPGRRERVLSVLRPRMILTEGDLASQLDSASIACVRLDAAGLLDAFPEETPGIAASGENLAYVIFTSGSTGDPKGVCCTHQGVINLYQDLQTRHPVGPGDACGLWTALSFDVSVYESWTSLLAGAALHIIPERVRTNPDACLSWLRDRKVITGYIPGFILPTLLEVQRHDPLPLRRLLVGVEPLSEALLCDIVAATPGLTLLNLYGPTEAAIYVTLYQAHDTQPRPAGNAPIGKAIQNTRIYILDPRMNPVPVGVPGELYIGGVGLARGYYNDPELTAKQFVPDPFSNGDTGRLYRTGDLVYFKPDGNIQFISRMGRYIKLRGYRIEPGEIESVLRAHPDIDDAVVVSHAGEISEELVAYVVGAEAHESVLRAFLESRLPAYMRPSLYVHLEALPRTVQGKLDRKLLPEPRYPRLPGDTDPDAPRTQTEIILAEQWRRALNIESIGRQENFFAMGGHSLLAIQLLAAIKESFGNVLTLSDFFDNPTIAGMAARVDASTGDTTNSDKPLLEIKPGKGIPFFCVKGAGDVGGSYQTFANALSDSQAFYGFPNLDFDDSGPPTVEHLAGRCIQEMKAVRPQGPYYIGGYSFGGIVAYEIARQLLESGDDVPLIAMLDSAAPTHMSVRRSFSMEYGRFVIERIRERFRTVVVTWKLHIGYLRDGLLLFSRRLLHKPSPQSQPLRLRDYYRWIRFDASVQYYRIEAGLAKSTMGERRLRMAEDQLIRHSAKSILSSRQATAEYVMTPISAEVTLFRAKHNPSRSERRDPTYGWSTYAEKGVRVVEVPGNHMVIIRHPYAEGLGKALQKVIDEVEANPR